MTGRKKDIEVKGIKEIQQMFESLPKQVSEKAVWQRFWRKNTKPMLKIAKNNVKQDTGQLKKSLGFFTTKKSRKFLGGYIGPRVKGAYRSKDKTGFYGAFIEYGGDVKFWGKGPAKVGDQPYMRPAWNEGKGIVLNNSMKDAIDIMAKAIKTHEARLNKYGKFGY
tara:strand:+ start:2730 stop:3224 length:495 start_codon:yes stop_codon:yes gene_type:complete